MNGVSGFSSNRLYYVDMPRQLLNRRLLSDALDLEAS